MAALETFHRPIRPDDVNNYEPPVPTPGCDICGACARQMREAKDPDSPAYDLSHATDLAVEIRRHPHDWKKGKLR
ncbi:hypothetical protein [Streptomyces sp. NPDC005302]|uniref:hypothetical protein n=1 Tax=Streptomyces sp. NPDC005302 TaxID=3154675 RepID=UPI0033B05AED